MAPRSRIKVLLAEDMDLLRSALVSLLSEEEDIEVVADLKCNDKVLAVASGQKSKSEEFGYGDNEFVPWQIGAVM